MRHATAPTSDIKPLLAAMLTGTLTQEQARQLAQAGPEAVVLALMAASAYIAKLEPQQSQQQPSAPSSATPPYLKPKVKASSKRPGAKPGHPGACRAAPAKIDQHQEHRLESCPCCGGPLQRCNRRRTRIIIDIPPQVEPTATEHTIHRDYCPSCKKHVEPVVPDAMPNATLGHRVVMLACWLHYGLGVTLGMARQVLEGYLKIIITAGGLIDAWNRVAQALFAWYEQIADEARAAAVLHADETGWRVDGQTHWLWCFATSNACYYMIDPSRGSPALQKFFIEAYQGTLISDFWAAYDGLRVGDHQKCLVHLLRELLKVDDDNTSQAWRGFSKQLKRLIKDGLRLRKRADFSKERYASRIDLINRRLWKLADATYDDADARRLAARIGKYRDRLFTFLDTDGVAADNNHAERMIRPAVIIRKNSLCNRSEQGAATQAVLMSIYRTLKLRGLDPLTTLNDALRQWLKTGQLPPLPPAVVAEG